MSMIGKIIGGANLLLSVYPAEVDDSDTGAAVDLNTYTGLQFVGLQIIGGVGGTDPTLDGKWQESANDSDWFDIAGMTHTQVIASNSTQAVVGTRSMRYVRHSRTVGGTTPTFVLTAGVIPFVDALTPGVATMPSVVISGTADSILIPAPEAGQIIRVHSIVCGSTADETIQFLSVNADTTETALTGLMPLEASKKPFALDYAKDGYFDCLEGESLRLNKSGVGTLGGFLSFSYRPA